MRPARSELHWVETKGTSFGIMNERKTKRVSLVGRLADDVTREIIPGRAFNAVLSASRQRALLKDEGYFVFTDLEPSVTDYEVSVDAPSYQRRTLAVGLPTTAAVHMTYPGEDELFIIVTGVNSAARRVSFEPIPFIPTIWPGSIVFGPGA